MRLGLRRTTCATIILLCIICMPLIHNAHGWGERGHDLVTRVAVHLLKTRHEPAPQLFKPFVLKQHMLAHLANVPDIVWRNADSTTRRLNGPTHYFSLDLTSPHPSEQPLPTVFPVIASSDKKTPQKLANSKVGSAPWRIRQLAHLMKAEFSSLAKPGKTTSKRLNHHVNQALLYGGLLAHFVGDLGNPMHTTKDYDGYERGQGGLHAYFETHLVSTLDLKLIQQVYMAANQRPMESSRKRHKNFVKTTDFPLEIALTLTRDSYLAVPHLLELDQRHAILKKGQTEPIKFPARRKPATEAAPHFEQLIIARLALAADALSEIWYWAWRSSGKPNLQSYKSWHYAVKPDFIEPDYQQPDMP